MAVYKNFEELNLYKMTADNRKSDLGYLNKLLIIVLQLRSIPIILLESGLVGLEVGIRIGRFLIRTPLGVQPNIGTRPRYEAPSDLRDELVEITVFNIGLVRLSPTGWPKVGRGTTKQQLKKTHIDPDYSALTEETETNPIAPKFNAGDRVRITKYKNICSRVYNKT